MTPYFDLPSQKKQEQSLALTKILIAEIKKKGPLSFSEFMEKALYYPKLGFYQAEDIQFGKKGHFTTAPEISPLFAAPFAYAIKPILSNLTHGIILELGAGTGAFAGDLLLSLRKEKKAPDYYYIYEVSEPLKQQQKKYLQALLPEYINRIKWLEQLP